MGLMILAKKSLGQNFLKDMTVAKSMVSALNISEGDEIIEIGPGLGALTKLILDVLPDSARLIAIELDPRAVEVLNTKFASCKNFELLNLNVLDFLPTFKSTKNLKIIGSLPYYITSPILHSFVKMIPQPQVGVFLVQKEVGKKISVSAPDASYFSSFLQSFYDVEYIQTVERTKFDPVPGVDSAVVKLIKNNLSDFDLQTIHKYEGFLHKGFSNPRKMLNKVFSAEELGKINFAPDKRPQNYNALQWVSAFKVLH